MSLHRLSLAISPVFLSLFYCVKLKSLFALGEEAIYHKCLAYSWYLASKRKRCQTSSQLPVCKTQEESKVLFLFCDFQGFPRPLEAGLEQAADHCAYDAHRSQPPASGFHLILRGEIFTDCLAFLGYSLHKCPGFMKLYPLIGLSLPLPILWSLQSLGYLENWGS
jgi:hypothetical protein